MLPLRTRLWRALTSNVARTHPEHRDRRLRGRRYAIPFQVVWDRVRLLADGSGPDGLRGWRRVRADEQAGVLEAESTTPLLRFVDDVRLTVTLDADGQTRVQGESRSRVGRADLGTNARRLHRFFRSLDQELEAAGWPTATPRSPTPAAGEER